jgi:hypothetical protein
MLLPLMMMALMVIMVMALSFHNEFLCQCALPSATR